MIWKDWSIWLKGGIIGLIIFLLLMIVSTFNSNSAMGFFFIFPIILFCRGNLDCLSEPMLPILGYVLLAFLYFIIGAIIGLIIGKIKSKKQ